VAAEPEAVVEEVIVDPLIAPGMIVPVDTVVVMYEEMEGEYKGRSTVDYPDIYVLYKMEVEMEKQRIEQPHPKIPYYHKTAL